MSQAAAEMDRRIANLVRFGTVVAYDLAGTQPLVAVDLGDVTTDMIPWAQPRAGETLVWDPPDLGEQCMVFSPSGELTQGAAYPAVNCDDFPADGDQNINLHRRRYKDGTVVEYDRETHVMNTTLHADGVFNVTVGTTKVEVDAVHIKLTAGGSTIEINSAGVTINGSAINLN